MEILKLHINVTGSNTVKSAEKSGFLSMPVMKNLGFFNIKGVDDIYTDIPEAPYYAAGRLAERSRGKDTTTGHWEIAGLVSEQAMPTFPGGFPKEFLEEFSRRTGRGWLCNMPYSGTDCIRDYGREHMETGALIVYTSADSVFQIAAHEDLVPPEQLYEYCRMARRILTGAYAVGRVIARPFETVDGKFKRISAARHDYSVAPPKDTMLNLIEKAGGSVYGIGKIEDIKTKTHQKTDVSFHIPFSLSRCHRIENDKIS